MVEVEVAMEEEVVVVDPGLSLVKKRWQKPHQAWYSEASIRRSCKRGAEFSGQNSVIRRNWMGKGPVPVKGVLGVCPAALPLIFSNRF